MRRWVFVRVCLVVQAIEGWWYRPRFHRWGADYEDGLTSVMGFGSNPKGLSVLPSRRVGPDEVPPSAFSQLEAHPKATTPDDQGDNR